MSEQDQCVFNAIASITAATDWLHKAEAAQVASDPITGPGSTEWEVVGAILAEATSALRMATDKPGELETFIQRPEFVAARLWYPSS